jgi:hypothetical protein
MSTRRREPAAAWLQHDSRKAAGAVAGCGLSGCRSLGASTLPPAGSKGKNAAAVALGRMGGKARAKGMTAKRRKEIAKKAAKTRWAETLPLIGTPAASVASQQHA